MKQHKRWLIPLLLVVLAAAAAGWFLTQRPAPQRLDEDTVIITVNGREYLRVPLSQPQTVTVSQESGAVNVIEITPEGAVMKSSTCENQLCVHMGEVTRDNWEWRVNGAFIICLPNRVTVELAVKEE